MQKFFRFHLVPSDTFHNQILWVKNERDKFGQLSPEIRLNIYIRQTKSKQFINKSIGFINIFNIMLIIYVAIKN